MSKNLFEMTEHEVAREQSKIKANQKYAIVVFGVTVFIWLFFTIGAVWFIFS